VTIKIFTDTNRTVQYRILTLTVTRFHSGTDSSWHSVVELAALQNLPRRFVGDADHICRNTRWKFRTRGVWL